MIPIPPAIVAGIAEAGFAGSVWAAFLTYSATYTVCSAGIEMSNLWYRDAGTEKAELRKQGIVGAVFMLSFVVVIILFGDQMGK
jgi:hypothetical protein